MTGFLIVYVLLAGLLGWQLHRKLVRDAAFDKWSRWVAANDEQIRRMGEGIARMGMSTREAMDAVRKFAQAMTALNKKGGELEWPRTPYGR